MAFAISVALLSLCGGAQAARHLRQAGNDAPSAASLLAGAPAPAKSYNYTKWAGRTYNMAALPGLPANGQVTGADLAQCKLLCDGFPTSGYGTGCTLFEFFAAISVCTFKTGPLSFETSWEGNSGIDAYAKVFAVPDGAGNIVNGVFHAGASFVSDGPYDVKISGFGNVVRGGADTIVGDNNVINGYHDQIEGGESNSIGLLSDGGLNDDTYDTIVNGSGNVMHYTYSDTVTNGNNNTFLNANNSRVTNGMGNLFNSTLTDLVTGGDSNTFQEANNDGVTKGTGNVFHYAFNNQVYNGDGNTLSSTSGQAVSSTSGRRLPM